MRAVLIPIVAYLFSRVHVVAVTGEEQQYVDHCTKAYGPNTSIRPAEGGGYQVRADRIASTADNDPATGDRKCCNRLNEVFSADSVTKAEGGCCQPNMAYSYDPVTNSGRCCGPGERYRDGDCHREEPLPARCMACSNKFACQCDGNLGIRYGHCYTMTDINGLHFNRAVDGTYQSGGDIDNLIFKVCKTTADCDADKGRFVPDDGTWSLQDQLGQRGDTGPGWFGNQLPHMAIANFKTPALAAIFRGEGYCMYGDCAICLRLFPDKGLSAPCPLGASAAMAHIGAANNPLNCKAYRFQEIKCVKGVPARPA
ncbi:hypothetical protein LOZ52_006569 [Ophidiomyces ophidiicola]|nr:hypothetical protein LOZ28_000694 [Ophidiomyces ophidiicola]KAI2225436.1 hypothetical protein LOZ15_000462 [Ophidiomyces ophidiicola]KAI2353015.1 hypothetical protein LOY92_002246 [Ophidiomyces ophidiicola]KAI2420935.1 hypothetical protein LOZ52_006569 [Ophidiomyces ophidiicola]KAI2447889.1 hypothetical protein LOZ08_000240 [Ophidiomyces ophidiicola]